MVVPRCCYDILSSSFKVCVEGFSSRVNQRSVGLAWVLHRAQIIRCHIMLNLEPRRELHLLPMVTEE